MPEHDLAVGFQGQEVRPHGNAAEEVAGAVDGVDDPAAAAPALAARPFLAEDPVVGEGLAQAETMNASQARSAAVTGESSALWSATTPRAEYSRAISPARRDTRRATSSSFAKSVLMGEMLHRRPRANRSAGGWYKDEVDRRATSYWLSGPASARVAAGATPPPTPLPTTTPAVDPDPLRADAAAAGKWIGAAIQSGYLSRARVLRAPSPGTSTTSRPSTR